MTRECLSACDRERKASRQSTGASDHHSYSQIIAAANYLSTTTAPIH